jgi:hypothetical protein
MMLGRRGYSVYRRLRHVLLVYTALVILRAHPSASTRAAETNTWLGGASNEWYDWFTPANWSLNRVPTESDVVVLNFGVVQVNASARFGRLELNAADIFGELQVDSLMHWNGGGTVSGSITVTSNGVIRLQESINPKHLLATAVTNYGTVIVPSDLAAWYWSAETVWRNLTGSLLEIGSQAGLEIPPGSPRPVLHNGGTIRVDTPGVAPWQRKIENDGLIEVRSGTLELWDGLMNSGTLILHTNTSLALRSGSFELCSGGTITGPGRVQITGDINIVGGTICGHVDWISGTLSGNLQIASNVVVRLPGWSSPGPPGLANGTFVTNHGTVIMEETFGGEFAWGGGVVWHNAPYSKLIVEHGGIALDLVVPVPLFVNEGEFTTRDDATVTVDMINQGTVKFGNGSTYLRRAYTQLSGTTQLDNSRLEGSLNLHGGKLSGAGWIQGTLSNAARVELPPATGTLTVVGEYVQGANGELALTIDPVTESGHPLEVLGPGTLAGRLTITNSNNTQPAPGQIFTVIACYPRTGEFEQIGGLGLGSGLRLEIAYKDNIVTLAAAVPPQRLTFASGSQGPITYRFDGDAERGFQLQASTNLVNWEAVLSTNTPTGIIDLMDPEAASYRNRFYRIFYP